MNQTLILFFQQYLDLIDTLMFKTNKTSNLPYSKNENEIKPTKPKIVIQSSEFELMRELIIMIVDSQPRKSGLYDDNGKSPSIR